MTRLLTCGYETGDVNEAGTAVLGANGSITVVSSAPAPRAGSYVLKVATTNNNFSQTYKSLALPAAKSEIWIRFAFLSHQVTPIEGNILYLQDPSSATQANLSYSGTDGLLRFRLGAGAGTLLGTAGTAFAQDTWHVIEVRQQMTSLTAGVTEVWLDGNRVINFSGDNVASTTAFTVQTVWIGQCLASGSIAGSGTYYAFDDIAINDVAGTINNGRPGDGRVVLLAPNGAGSSTQFVRGGTDTGANYSQVNELPPSLTQYVGSSTVGNRDLYALADLPVAVQAINVVEVLALAQNSDAGGGNLAPTVKSGATTNEATAIGLSTSAGYVTGRWETDPNTSAAWTAAAVNALEAGATAR